MDLDRLICDIQESLTKEIEKLEIDGKKVMYQLFVYHEETIGGNNHFRCSACSDSMSEEERQEQMLKFNHDICMVMIQNPYNDPTPISEPTFSS